MIGRRVFLSFFNLLELENPEKIVQRGENNKRTNY